MLKTISKLIGSASGSPVGSLIMDTTYCHYIYLLKGVHLTLIHDQLYKSHNQNIKRKTVCRAKNSIQLLHIFMTSINF